jgi:hypothetical protein
MAKVKEGSGLELSGKADGRVYVQFNGGTYTRSLPRRTKDSVTPSMLLSQKRFGEISHFCKKFKWTVIPQIWKAEAVRMSGYAFFMKANMPAFGPDGSLADPKMLKLSIGKLTLPEGLDARRTAAGSSTIQVNWQKDLHLGGVHLKDELMVISAAGGNFSEITGTGITRLALGGSFERPPLPIPATHIYLFFASKDRRDYSESVCFEV